MRWVALLALAGCTQVFGLDSTHDDDRDGDHVPDATDNCPDVANPDQSKSDPNSPLGDACRQCMTTDTRDSDGDGIPDQCDACDNRLPDANGNGVPDACEHPHDEDGDGRPDLFDNCPALANGQQQDTTDVAGPDGVGDACDDSPAGDRQIFDGFVEDNQLWYLGEGDWLDGNDESHVSLDNSAVYSRFAGVGIDAFVVSAKVSLQGNGFAGVWAIDASKPQTVVQCGVYRDPAAQVVRFFAESGTTITGIADFPIASTDHVTVHMSFSAASGTVLTAFCGVDDQPVFAKLPVSSGTPIFHPGLVTNGYSPPTLPPTSMPITGTAVFDWYDLVTSKPRLQ